MKSSNNLNGNDDDKNNNNNTRNNSINSSTNNSNKNSKETVTKNSQATVNKSNSNSGEEQAPQQPPSAEPITPQIPSNTNTLSTHLSHTTPSQLQQQQPQEQGDSRQQETNLALTNADSSAEKVDEKSVKWMPNSDGNNNNNNNNEDDNQNNQEHSSRSSIGSYICRICQSSDNPQRMISPCECRGTLAYVHRNCLEYWLSRSGLTHCELCMHRFESHSTLRFGFFESIRIWYNHPNHRGVLQADLFVCSMLTLITFSLIMIIIFGLQYFAMQSKDMGLPKLWTEASLIIFLTIVVLAYTVNAYIIFREHFSPWFRWWRSARRIELVLTNTV